MNKIISLLTFTFLLLLQNAHAQSDTTHPSAKVYIIRQTGINGSIVNFRAIMNDSTICKIKNNRYYILNMAPGLDTFYITSWANAKKAVLGLPMEIEAGQTYYLRMVIKERYLEDQLYFEEITYNSAGPILKKCKQETVNE